MQKLSLDALGRLDVEEYKKAEKLPVCFILDNIRSLHNVGSAFRTADAFRVEKIWLCGITGVPPHREIHKSALGATESVDWDHRDSIVELIQDLKKTGYKIVAVEQTDKSSSLEGFQPDKENKIALIFGNEVSGISDDILPLLDESIEIPQFGTKHSFNVSVSIGIVIWEIYKKLKIKF
ncbi:MAG: RNA methyltransferase [Candidatus Cyclobacteriaceae bacterium M2_1C_046]